VSVVLAQYLDNTIFSLYIKKRRPDLTFLDVVMPGKDGFQTCRKLKNEDLTKDIKIVMVTSKSQKTDESWRRKQWLS